MSSGSPFEAVWARVRAQAGEFFKTSEGRWFTYKVDSEELIPSQTENLRIPRADFELAFPLLPVPPAKLNKFVNGPAYVWAILHDPRVSDGQW